MINGKNALAGCVAIALGQILNYHMKDNHKVYDWDKIGISESPYIGKFIRDIGDAVDMDYGLLFSGANSENAVGYLKVAGYPNAHSQEYNYKLFKKSIDKGNPVYLFGGVKKTIKKGIWFIFRWGWKSVDTYTEGHAWVGDGYKESESFQKTKIIQRGTT